MLLKLSFVSQSTMLIIFSASTHIVT